MADSLSRRRFLQGASALGAAAAVGACTGGSDEPTAGPATTTTAPVRGNEGVLVIVTLYGGNDALNTVAPVNDPTYQSLRGALALDPATTHDIGDGFSLHPALSGCKGLWDAGRLAVVHGVGFDNLDRSHFHCMDVWQAGNDEAPTSGWIGRWLDAVGSDPLDAVSIGRGLPLLARGSSRSAAVIPVGPFELPGDRALQDLLATMSEPDSERSTYGELVASSTADLLAVASTVTPIVASQPLTDSLSSRFATIATLMEADLPTRVYATDLGGFDTHSAQPGTHEALLSEVDTALTTFLDRAGERPVTVLVYSEFGRRVEPNASNGTDHGKAGTALLAGNVRPGHHGDPPPLDRLVDGDLVTTVDYRSIYAGLLEGVLGIEADDVLDDAPSPLELV
ncbi:MAG: DUF1501 domain-containing protein [Actinomycetota bacterium]